MKKLITRGLAITAAAIVLTGCISDADDNKSSSIFEAQPDIKASENTNDNAGGETENIVGQSANSESSQSDEAKEENDYSRYLGVWTTDGISNEELLENGGTKLTLNISNGNQASGSLFSQQGTTDRIANIDFSGEIHDNQLVYSFTDDGWDGKGTLNFTFINNEVDLNVTDYVMSEDNRFGWGISGSYVFLLSKTSKKDNRNNCSFYPEITDYLEAHGCTDTSNTSEPLFNTDSEYYTAEDFADTPKSVIRVAKNEIYARHGYIFNDLDISNYFNGMDWYTPSIDSTNFSDNVFNEYEKANLELLNSIQ